MHAVKVRIGRGSVPRSSRRVVNDAVAILRDTMIEAGKTYLSRVPIEVEVTFGDTWAEKYTRPAATLRSRETISRHADNISRYAQITRSEPVVPAAFLAIYHRSTRFDQRALL
jgi:hypothetical protein